MLKRYLTDHLLAHQSSLIQDTSRLLLSDKIRYFKFGSVAGYIAPNQGSMQCGGIRGHRKTNEPRRGYLMGSEFMRSEIFMAALIFWNPCFGKSTRIADCTRPVARSWFLLATILTGGQPRERYWIFC